MNNFTMPVFPSDREHPSMLAASYYERLTQLVKLGVFDFGVSVLSPDKITAHLLNRYFDYPDDFPRSNCGKRHSKLSGAVAAEHFRQALEKVLHKHQAPYKISQNNAYVQGCRIEFDFLILKKDAQCLLDMPVYRPCDVVAVLECKANGIYEYNKSSLERLFEAYFQDLNGYRRRIKLGYMTISENCPNAESGSANFIRHTLLDFSNRFDEQDPLWNCFFARCHYTSRKPDRFMTDEQWEQFVLSLLPGE